MQVYILMSSADDDEACPEIEAVVSEETVAERWAVSGDRRWFERHAVDWMENFGLKLRKELLEGQKPYMQGKLGKRIRL